MKKCKNCETLTNNPKFCSRSCAASFNTKGRKHSQETKQKISISLGGNGTSERICKICNNGTGSMDRQYCDNCRPKASFSEQALNAGSLSFTYYEKELCKILSKEFGQLRKEKINEKYFDFCNDQVIIDFTFDKTKGTYELIERFVSLKNDNRSKIAYVPGGFKNTPKFNQLTIRNIEIRDSNVYRETLNI